MAAFHLSGADDDEVGAADLHALLFRAGVKLVVADAFAILQPRHAAEARDVEQHTAPVHLVLGVLDAEYREAAGVDQLGRVAVVGLVLVKDVAERIPVRCALHAKHQRVVGVTQLVPVLLAGECVGAGG